MTCRICGHDAEHPTFDAREMMFGFRHEFRYFRCMACGCLQIEEFPADIPRYYPEEYYSYQMTGARSAMRRLLSRIRDEYALHNRGIAGWFLYARRPKDEMRCLHPLHVTPSTRILDVGCGAGLLLHELHDLGMRNVFGIDPFNARDIVHDNGVRIEKKRLSEVEGSWDVVMLHHSLEHMPDQSEAMRHISRLLAPEGRALVRIPLASSHAWEHYGVNWIQLDAPRHLFLHSTKSMRMLAEKAGLEIYDTVFDSTAFQFWASEQYLRDIPLRDPRSHAVDPKGSMFSRAQLAAFERRARDLNAERRGDQAVFYLRNIKA